jgi:hypothetical protein
MRSKYGAKGTTVDGILFASKREAKRWSELQLLLRAGEIRDLQRQVSIQMQGQNGPIRTPTGRGARYVADFVYYDCRLKADVIEDSKGFATPEFKLKKAILAAMGLDIKEV